MTLFFRHAACIAALAISSGCAPVPPRYFAPHAVAGRPLPNPHRDGARFDTDGAYQLSAGVATVDLELVAGADGAATGLFLKVHVPAGSTSGFAADSLALTADGATVHVALPFSLSRQPFDTGAAAAPSLDSTVMTWKANVALPRSQARAYDVQLPDLVVDGVPHALPVVQFRAARGWAWYPGA